MLLQDGQDETETPITKTIQKETTLPIALPLSLLQKTRATATIHPCMHARMTANVGILPGNRDDLERERER